MRSSLPERCLRAFLSSVRDLYRQKDNAQIEMLAEMADFLDELLAESAKIYPTLYLKSLLPALEHLPTAVDFAGEKTRKIAGNISQLAPLLHWQQTKGYEVLGEDYLKNYGYCSLIGPGLLIEHDSLKLGFGLWGPNLHYPVHKHAAEECYHVLGSDMEFRRENEAWQIYCGADAIYNKPWEIHELRSVGKPMFLLYSWRGDVAVDALLA